MPDRCFAVTDRETGQEFYVKAEQDDDCTKTVSASLEVIGNATEASALEKAFKEKNTKRYVFRKMGVDEFNQTLEEKKMMYALTKKKKNINTAEKWYSENLDHTRAFANKGNTGPDRVVEFAVERNAYEQLSDAAIFQDGSSKFQPKEGTPYNVYNKEHLDHLPNRKNIGLKGRANVDTFNKTVISVSEIDPHSFTNKSSILRWVRRNKISAAGIAFGVVLDVTSITITAIEEGGFGTNTKVAIGQAVGGAAGASAAVAIGAQIGAALGTVIPGIGNIVLGFIGGLIGGLIGGGITSFIFHVDPVAPGLGPPLLDTDPRDTARGVPDDDLYTGARGVPSMGISTGASGIPSLGLDTGALGTPKADYETEGW